MFEIFWKVKRSDAEFAADRRANALHLTAEGQQFLARIRSMHDAMEDHLVDRLGGPQARDQLFALLDRLS